MIPHPTGPKRGNPLTKTLVTTPRHNYQALNYHPQSHYLHHASRVNISPERSAGTKVPLPAFIRSNAGVGWVI
ncbi:unnamed protein product [Periconia digitata]|uniref:Uncharacterized protein n=1 Tax=Periconia digitata TaxID=1303443 RepID=A0A9W4UVP3_9PLEO|nr:unnamed protein product [Periconia digitata]